MASQTDKPDEADDDLAVRGLPSYCSEPRLEENPDPPPYTEAGDPGLGIAETRGAALPSGDFNPEGSRVINFDIGDSTSGSRYLFPGPGADVVTSSGTHIPLRLLVSDPDVITRGTWAAAVSHPPLYPRQQLPFIPPGGVYNTTDPIMRFEELVEEPRAPSFIEFSCFVALCCNIICGCLAVYFSLMSMAYSENGQRESARRMSRTAIVFNLLGIVCTLILIFLLLPLLL